MLQPDIQPSKTEELSAEELQSQKAQQTIEYLLKAANQNETLKRQLKAVTSLKSLVEIAIHHGYELTIADLETLQLHRQQPTQLHSDDLDGNELAQQELELVTGGSGFIPSVVVNGIVFGGLLGNPTNRTKR